MTDTLPRNHACPAETSPDSVPSERHLIVARQDAGAEGDGSSCGLIRLQVFSSDGSACGPEITIDAATMGGLLHAMSALADGRFALAWDDVVGPGLPAQPALRVQVFNADGSPWPTPGASAGTGEDDPGASAA